MVADSRGFRYPEVDEKRCMNCGRCIQNCIENRQTAPGSYTCHALASADPELRKKSTSGGIFGELARRFLMNKGAVAGAAFTPEFAVEMTIIHTLAELPMLQGSKYVQADIPEDFYKRCVETVHSGTPMLFSGTPCQIAAMKNALHGEEYENLLLVEVICHGVPSPTVWKAYLDYTCQQLQVPKAQIARIAFRDKCSGWTTSSFVVEKSDTGTLLAQTEKQNGYMQLFGRNVILRPACAECQVKEGRSGADISLGDFWGLKKTAPELFDEKGTTLGITHTPKGKFWIDKISTAVKQEFPSEIMNTLNPPFKFPTPLNRASDKYFSLFAANGNRWFPPEDFIKTYAKNSIKAKFRRFFARIKEITG